jgi:hypothetical protein
MQGSGLKQSAVRKAHGSHMWSLKVDKIITYGFSKIWHSMCDVSYTGAPYTEYNTKNPLFFICKYVIPWEYDAGAHYFQNYLSNTSIKTIISGKLFYFVFRKSQDLFLVQLLAFLLRFSLFSVGYFLEQCMP